MKRNQLLSAVNPLTVHPHWKYLEEYLDTLIEHDLDLLLGCTSWDQAKETQGRIKAYKAIRTLSETVNAAKRDRN